MGVDIGGRYGTASVGFQPVDEPNGFRRRQGVIHGTYIGSHVNWERPFGNFTLYAGLRTEWGYTWTNLLPPNNSDISDINLLLNFGIRY